MPKFLPIGLAATGLAAAAAAGYQAGVSITNKQAQEAALPEKPANDLTAATVLVQEIVKEMKDKQGLIDEKHLAKKVHSMTRCLALDKDLAQKLAQERVEKSKTWLENEIARQKAVTEDAEREAERRAELARIGKREMEKWEDEKREAKEKAERWARQTPEERKKEEEADLEFYIRCKEYGGVKDTFT